MKSSQSIPGPQSGTSPVAGGVMAGSPQIAQATAADPSSVSEDVTHPTDQGHVVADALRRFVPTSRVPSATSAGSSQSPERRSLGGWQSLMQRMRPQ